MSNKEADQPVISNRSLAVWQYVMALIALLIIALVLWQITLKLQLTTQPEAEPKPSPTSQPEPIDDSARLTSPDSQFMLTVPALTFPANSQLALLQYGLNHWVTGVTSLGNYGFEFKGDVHEQMQCDEQNLENYCLKPSISLQVNLASLNANKDDDCQVSADQVIIYMYDNSSETYQPLATTYDQQEQVINAEIDQLSPLNATQVTNFMIGVGDEGYGERCRVS
jgi:hypothetical protein